MLLPSAGGQVRRSEHGRQQAHAGFDRDGLRPKLPGQPLEAGTTVDILGRKKTEESFYYPVCQMDVAAQTDISSVDDKNRLKGPVKPTVGHFLKPKRYVS